MGDLRLVKADYEYDLNYEGYTKYKTFESEGAFGHDNELEVRIKPLSMERANTIAIYEANSTFVGHYQEQEKMNVIQLWVTDDGTGTPFQKGPNAIVISTSLFGNTKLHSMLEKEQLEQTPLWSPIAGDYQFIAVDRDKNSKSDGASNNVDFVIIRRAISSAQAMDVLDLLMTCYVNESLDEATNQTVYEEAKLYTYASTKINGTKAVKMNLHVDVLGYVPYFSDYKNSEQGQEPNNKSKFTATFILVVVGMIAAIVVCAVLAVYSGGGTALVMIGLICMLIYMLDAYLPGIAEILTMITAFMIELVMTILTWLGPLGMLILRAIMLVLIWIEFAFIFILVNSVLYAMKGAMLIFQLFMDLQIFNKANEIEVQGTINFTCGYNTGEEYFEYLDINCPTLNLYFISNNFTFEFQSCFFSDDFKFPNFLEDLLAGLVNSSSSQSSSIPQMSSTTSTEDNLYSFLNGLAFGIGIAGGIVGSVAGLFYIIKDETENRAKKIAIIVAGMIILCATVHVALLRYELNPESYNFWYIRGLGWGLIGAAIAFFWTAGWIHTHFTYHHAFYAALGTAQLLGIFALFDLFYGIVGIFTDLTNLRGDDLDNYLGSKAWTTIISLAGGVLSLFLACEAIIDFGGNKKSHNYKDHTYKGSDKKYIALTFCTICLVIGIDLLIRSRYLEYLENEE